MRVAYDWPQIYSTAGQWLQTYSQGHKNYLQPKKEWEVLEVMAWTPQRLELNIKECVWDDMKREKDLTKPTATEDLWLVF